MGSSSAIFPGATQSELDAIDDALSLPTLAAVLTEERPTPTIAEAPAFTLTAPISQRRAHQPRLSL